MGSKLHPVIKVGSKFQTDGPELWKARFANSVFTKGLISSGTSDKCNIHADLAQLDVLTEMCWYCGAADLSFITANL